MLDIHIPVYDAAAFTYRDKQFVAEMSDLSCFTKRFVVPRPTEKKFASFALHNRDTNVVVYFQLHQEKRDADGDLTVEIFRPIAREVRENPRLSGVEVHILND